MDQIISAIFVIVGLMNFAPLIGILGSNRLKSLYGLDFEESNLLLLMRHRAVLFGIVGAFIIYSAFDPLFQIVGFIAGFISMLSFILMALPLNNQNEQIRKVFWLDIAGIVIMLIGLVLFLIK